MGEYPVRLRVVWAVTTPYTYRKRARGNYDPIAWIRVHGT